MLETGWSVALHRGVLEMSMAATHRCRKGEVDARGEHLELLDLQLPPLALEAAAMKVKRVEGDRA
jgi:hypothetical protein